MNYEALERAIASGAKRLAPPWHWWIFHVLSWPIWRLMAGPPSWWNNNGKNYVGIFGNERCNGGRWGFFILGFEVGPGERPP